MTQPEKKRNRHLQRAVRRRMAVTGENYTTALRKIKEQENESR